MQTLKSPRTCPDCPVPAMEAAGPLAFKRYRMRDPMAGGRPREIDVWLGTREAWDASGLTTAPGWSAGPVAGGLILAVRLV